MEAIRTRARNTESHCPYCHDGFQDGDRVVACGGCATVYHQDCLQEELRSCASLGCDVRPELGKATAWEDREGLAGALTGGKGLSCCPQGEAKGGAIRVCLGCGSLLHAECLGRAGRCCPGAGVARLLDRDERPGVLTGLGTLLSVWAGLGLLLLFLYGVLAEPDDMGRYGTVAGWVVAGLIYFGFGSVLFVARFIDARMRREDDDDT